MDKGSELYRCLKTGYLFRTGQEVNIDEERELLRKEPFIMLLFAKEPAEELMLRMAPR